MENENKKALPPEEAPVTPEEIPAEELQKLDEDFLSYLPTGLGEDEDFQDALNALESFSARYDIPTEASAEAVTAEETSAVEEAPTAEEAPAIEEAPTVEESTIPEEAKEEAHPEEAPQKEVKPMYVSEDTVPFTAPVTPQADDLGKTQKFTPVSGGEKPIDVSGLGKPRRAGRRRAPARKGRPAPKKGYGLFGIPHVISTCIWLAIIVTIGISLGRILWVCAADLLAFGKPDKVITITIEEGDTTEVIAAKLEQAGLIRYPNLFIFFADITGKAERVIPDTYNLNAMYDYNALLKMMSYKQVNTDVVEIMIPEGYNCAQIFKLLEEKGVCSVEDLEEWAANGELKDYWFLEGLPRGTKYCLEGYLYPDTYKFYKDAEPQYVLQKFLNAFDNRFTDKMYNDFLKMQERYAKMLKSNGYSNAWIESHKLTFHQLITVASIVEEEKANSAEGYDIAAVFYNRLTKASHYPRLDSDATVYYAIGAYFERKPLTREDLNCDSPYNTRKSNGLPPGPITNPGSYSLYAALYPSTEKYYYFIFDKTAGVHRFSKTLAEHNKWAEELG